MTIHSTPINYILTSHGYRGEFFSTFGDSGRSTCKRTGNAIFTVGNVTGRSIYYYPSQTPATPQIRGHVCIVSNSYAGTHAGCSIHLDQAPHSERYAQSNEHCTTSMLRTAPVDDS